MTPSSEADTQLPGSQLDLFSLFFSRKLRLLRGCSARLWESEEWQPLYRDWCDGRSFNALLKASLEEAKWI